MTDELLQNYEQEQRMLSIGSRGNFKLQTQQQPQQQNMQKSSPKNSDYIKQSILLQSNSKSKKRPNFKNRNSNFMEHDECPSFFDELDFDEDHPIANKKDEILQNFQSTAP